MMKMYVQAVAWRLLDINTLLHSELAGDTPRWKEHISEKWLPHSENRSTQTFLKQELVTLCEASRCIYEFEVAASLI